jgi:hypothetical protein
MKENQFIQSPVFRHLIIFFILCNIAFVFGISSVKTSHEYYKSIDSDVSIYLDITEKGFEGITNDHRSTRLLIPIIAHYISMLNPFEGKYDSPQIYLFVASFIFFYLSSYLLYLLAREFNSHIVSIISVIIFFLHFLTVNSYFAGLPDTAEYLFSIILFYLLLNARLYFLFPLFFIAALNRESFFLYGSVIVFAWPFLTNKREQALKYLIYSIILTLIFIFTVFSLKIFLQDNLYLWFSNLQTYADPNYRFNLLIGFDNIRNFLYYSILIIPFGLIGLRKQQNLFYSAIIVIIIYLVIVSTMVGSGAALGRYIFSSAGPLLMIGTAIVVANILKIKV